MSKDIVILSSSPRIGGNSDILCGKFMEATKEVGHNTRIINLYKKNIGFCQACYHCFSTGRCILNDDMEEILEEIEKSDVIVVATPTYFITMNAILKNTIDRFLPKWKDLGGHDVYIIITGHDSKDGLKLVEEELRTIFTKLGNNVKQVIYGEGVWKKGEVLETNAMDEVYTAGLNV